MRITKIKTTCLLVFATIIAIGGYWAHVSESLFERDQRLLMSAVVSAQASAIERRLAHSLSSTYILAQELKRNKGVFENFESYAADVIRSTEGVSNLQLAPNGIVRQIYPLVGNEKALGHNILRDDRRKQEAQQAANLAMLGLMQRLTFNAAQIRFEDDGVTAKALDYAGKKQGSNGPQMAQMIKAMTPIVLSQYNIPELQNMLSQAVNTYLDKPENLTITAEPANPVPFPMIMGAAMGAPNTLPNVLGVKVSAND